MLELARKSEIKRTVLDQILPESFFGFDFFVSYSWRDGREYAIALTEQLKTRGFKCWLDSEDYVKGDDWR